MTEYNACCRMVTPTCWSTTPARSRWSGCTPRSICRSSLRAPGSLASDSGRTPLVGLSPKVFQRVLRMQRFLAATERLDGLANAAAEAGYTRPASHDARGPIVGRPESDAPPSRAWAAARERLKPVPFAPETPGFNTVTVTEAEAAALPPTRIADLRIRNRRRPTADSSRRCARRGRRRRRGPPPRYAGRGADARGPSIGRAAR